MKSELPTSNERLEIIKQSPRQAGVDDVEWMCEEIERLKAEVVWQINYRLAAVETTADDESFFWVVLDDHGNPMHVTVHKQMGHDHINECIGQHIDAGLWRVVQVQIVDERPAVEPARELSSSEAASFNRTLANSPRRVEPSPPPLKSDVIRDLACCDTFVPESASEFCATCGYANVDHLRKRPAEKARDEPPGLICSKCGVDRFKATCPNRFVDCPMHGTTQQVNKDAPQ